MDNVLVIGSGGREHAIVWKLQQSEQVANIYVFPGSQAIAQLEKASIVNDLDLKNFEVGRCYYYPALSYQLFVFMIIFYPLKRCILT